MNAIGFKRKELGPYYPTIAGGTDIFRNFFDGGWGEAKRMGAYSKSLYVYACVSKIAQKVASIDWELYKIKNTAGDKEQVFVHEALDLLYRPNPFQTKGEFFERYMINKKLTGQAFILKVRDGRGKVAELWNLRPDYMRILLDPEQIIKGYEFTAGSKTTVFAPEDIIYDSYPDPLSDFGGVSPLQAASARVDVEEFATKYQRNFFINNARPDFLILSEKKISAEQKEDMRESWDKRHKAGKDQKNVAKGAFLEGGVEYQQVSITQQEMDYIESLKLTRDDILVAFQVPKPIVAITEDVNYANAETAMDVFLSETIVPEIRQLTEKLNEHLVYPEYGDTFFLDFEDPVPENEKEMAEIQQIRINSGTLLINEAREQWGDEPVKGGWSLWKPFSEQPVGGLPQNDSSKTAARLGDDNGQHYLKEKTVDNQKVFRGRRKAFKFLKEVERIEKILIREAARLAAKERKQKAMSTKIAADGKKYVPLVKEEHTKAYYEMKIKEVDQQGEMMVDPLNSFMEGQKQRVVKYLQRADKSKKIDPADLDEALQKWAGDEVPLVADFSLPFLTEWIRQAGEEAMNMVAPAETFDETVARVQKYLKERTQWIAKNTTLTTYDALQETLAEGLAEGEGMAGLIARVDDVYADFPLYRSRMIARTEATAVNNHGLVEAWRQSGIANAKQWISTLDGKARHSHESIHLKIEPLDGTFPNGLKEPGEIGAPASEVINCRCALAPAFIEEEE